LKRLLLCLFLLGGCATSSGPVPSDNTSQISPEKLSSARVHTELAANYYSRGQYSIALDELGIALRTLPNYGPAYNMLGLVYMDLKEDAKAAQSFEQALKFDPNDSDANNNYGWFLCQRSDPAKSFAYFAAAQRNPLYTTPERSLVNAGICSRKVNDPVAAEKYFMRALALRPTNTQALHNLAELSFQRGEFAESRNYLSRYMRLDSNPSAEALWLAVRVERRLGSRGAEANYAAQICQRFPDSSQCRSVRTGAER